MATFAIYGGLCGGGAIRAGFIVTGKANPVQFTTTVSLSDGDNPAILEPSQ